MSERSNLPPKVREAVYRFQRAHAVGMESLERKDYARLGDAIEQEKRAVEDFADATNEHVCPKCRAGVKTVRVEKYAEQHSLVLQCAACAHEWILVRPAVVP